MNHRLVQLVSLAFICACSGSSGNPASSAGATAGDRADFPEFHISAGNEHTCALMNTGAVKCWGANGSGQLGQDNTDHLGDQAGEMAALASVNLGTNDNGTPGDSSDDFPRTAKMVSVGKDHSCVIMDDDSVKCWGANDKGQLGQDNTDNLGDQAGEMAALASVNLGTNDNGTPGDSSDDFPHTAKALSAGSDHTCVILDNDSLKCWGNNNFGQLGQGDNNDRGDSAGEMAALAAIDLGSGRTVKAMSVGALSICAILDNNRPKCWGNNGSGELGLGDTAIRGRNPGEMGDNLPFVNVGFDDNGTPADTSDDIHRTVKAIANGRYHTCVIMMDDDSVKCWGSITTGAQISGNTTRVGGNTNQMGNNLTPANLGTGRSAKAISLNWDHSCVLLDNDSLKCWGNGGGGKLGQGSVTNLGDNASEVGDGLSPISLGGNFTPKALSAGGTHNCAVSVDDQVKCWGDNYSGQLGQGSSSALGDGIGEMGDNLLPILLGM